jgi:hypothetical protein
VNIVDHYYVLNPNKVNHQLLLRIGVLFGIAPQIRSNENTKGRSDRYCLNLTQLVTPNPHKTKSYKMFKLAKSLPVAALVLFLGCSIANATHSTKYSTNPSSPASGSTSQGRKAETLPDTVIIPGERVGSVTRDTTRQDLTKRFGAERLTDQQVSIGEGFTEPGTRVDLGSDRSFTVVWADATRTKPVAVRNFGTAWQTTQGIGVGMSLNQLQQKLGSFQFYGFAWDYGGTVLLERTKLSQYKGKLILRLRTAPNVAEKEPNHYRAVIGDRKFSSTNPHLKTLGITVGEMIVRLAPN